MTPFSSVAMLEKLALLKIAFCKAPVLSRAASRRTSVMASALPASPSRKAELWICSDMAANLLMTPTASAGGLALHDDARGEQCIDLPLTVARLAKDLYRVLAELRRKSRRGLRDALEPERARHGERRARARGVEGHQGATGDHLRIVPRVVHGADLTEGEAMTVQDFSPPRPWSRSEDLVQDGHERARVGAPG